MPATKAATTTKTKTKTTAAEKKPATKAKKPAAKKPKAKKKVAAKKAAPKKKVKKVVLTPEQQKRLRVRELKTAALLEEPKKLPTNTFRVYAEQQFATEPTSDLKLTDRVKGIAESYKNLSSYDVQVRADSLSCSLCCGSPTEAPRYIANKRLTNLEYIAS